MINFIVVRRNNIGDLIEEEWEEITRLEFINELFIVILWYKENEAAWGSEVWGLEHEVAELKIEIECYLAEIQELKKELNVKNSQIKRYQIDLEKYTHNILKRERQVSRQLK